MSEGIWAVWIKHARRLSCMCPLTATKATEVGKFLFERTSEISFKLEHAGQPSWSKCRCCLCEKTGTERVGRKQSKFGKFALIKTVVSPCPKNVGISSNASSFQLVLDTIYDWVRVQHQ